MELMREYFDKTKLVAHQIKSFNDLVNNGLQRVILRDRDVKTPNGATISFGEVSVGYPHGQVANRVTKKVFPNDARNNQFTYDAHIFVNVSITTPEGEKIRHNRVSIGKMPIMLGSCRCNLNAHNRVEKYECPNDFGGYFIINGKEKVLVSQLRPLYNKVYVYPSNDKYVFGAEIRTMGPGGNSLLIRAKSDANENILLSLPYIKDHLEPGLVFRAMGLTEKDLKECLVMVPEDVVETILENYLKYGSQDEAITEVANSLPDRDENVVRSILQREMFCHLGHLTPQKSAIHLGFMIKKLIETVRGVRVCDDKDSLANKRLDTSNALLLFIFQSLYKQMLKNIAGAPSLKKGERNAPKDPDYLAIIKASSNITYKMATCFTSTTWDVQKGSSFAREGVSQMMCRQNYGAFVSHKRRLMLPVGKKGKIINMRQLAPSHFGFICPYETPEGQQVGTVMNLALSAEITIETPHMDVLEILKQFKMFDEKIDKKNLVLLNGVLVGSTSNSLGFYSEFYRMRESDMIENTVSISRLKQENEIHIYSDQGRFIRPLFRVAEGNKVKYQKDTKWDKAVEANMIVFRDPAEIEQSVIAPHEKALTLNKCDYMEISPAAVMMGVMAAVIPFSNNSQSPRLAYQSCMGKQAQGIPSLAYKHRWDTTLHVLDTPQKPLSQSKIVNIIKFDEMSHGCVPIVAIMSFTGFNQEDGFILNKGSIDRGLFRSTTYKTIIEEAKKRGNSDFESICIPKPEYRKREYNYEHLGPDGVIKKPSSGSLYIKKGDVLIGKTLNKMIKVDDRRDIKTIDISVEAKQNEEGYLDEVYDTVTPEGVRVVKVRVRIQRIPEIGDKFASSCAQKGTCGMIISQEDMPFDSEGICPDLIMNPHALPSRMTINMLIEMGYNLAGVKMGKTFDATAFEDRNITKELTNILKEEGSDSYAKTMYCGLTGKKLTAKIFMAPSFFQRLKHMVSDKFHARRCGPLDTVTHQPVAGRAKDGGLKCGEMERDSLIVHGCSEFLHETMFTKSDKYHVPICKTCGNIPANLTSCANCKDDNVEVKNLPYAAKLLFQQFMGMGIKVKFS